MAMIEVAASVVLSGEVLLQLRLNMARRRGVSVINNYIIMALLSLRTNYTLSSVDQWTLCS